jgi:hypothetical protein
MTIERVEFLHGDEHDYLVTCNHANCRASIDGKSMTFTEVVDMAKRAGWKPIKSFGTWHHYCPAHHPSSGPEPDPYKPVED